MPEHLSFSKDVLLNDIYINLQAQLKNFGLNRFVPQKNDNNMISGMVFASGPIWHPYVSVNVDSVSILLAANMFHGRGTVVVEDRDISISDLNIEMANLTVSNIQGSGSLEDFSLNATGELNYDLMDKNIYAPLSLSVGNAIVPAGKLLPDSISATLSTKSISGSLVCCISAL